MVGQVKNFDIENLVWFIFPTCAVVPNFVYNFLNRFLLTLINLKRKKKKIQNHHDEKKKVSSKKGTPDIFSLLVFKFFVLLSRTQQFSRLTFC